MFNILLLGNNFYVLGGWNAQTSNGFCTSSQGMAFRKTD